MTQENDILNTSTDVENFEETSKDILEENTVNSEIAWETQDKPKKFFSLFNKKPKIENNDVLEEISSTPVIPKLKTKKTIPYSKFREKFYIVIRNFNIFTTILFFSNLLFVWSKFFLQITQKLLPFTYLAFCLNFFLFLFFATKKEFKITNKKTLIILWIILFILFVVSYLPML